MHAVRISLQQEKMKGYRRQYRGSMTRGHTLGGSGAGSNSILRPEGKSLPFFSLRGRRGTLNAQKYDLIAHRALLYPKRTRQA